MLVLADSDGLRVDFYEFGQGVLDAPGNGYGTADGYIQVRKFGTCQIGGGVYGGPGFIGDNVGARKFSVTNQGRYKLFRFIRSCTVADGDEIDSVGLNKTGKRVGSQAFLFFRTGEHARTVVKDISCRIDDGSFATGAVSRVQTKDRLLRKGRLHQKTA